MCSKIICKGQIKGFPLIKIQEKDTIDLIKKGSIRLNSLKVYRDFYNKYGDKTIGDPNEGKFIIHDAILKIPELGINQKVKDQAFATANENDFVFCLFGINPNKYSSFNFTEEQKQKLMGFHDTALIITDVHEFSRRMYDAANSLGLKMTSGFVSYYDETVDDVVRLCNLVCKGIESIVYYQTKDYSYQQEYRFSIPNNIGKDYEELQIGDISGITLEVKTEELFEMYIQKRD